MDLGAYFTVDRVVIYNRKNGFMQDLQSRLSNSIVELYDENNGLLGTYTIGDASKKRVFTIPVSAFKPSLSDLNLKLSSDRVVARSAMHACDESMKLLLGSTMSLGTFRGKMSFGQN